MKHTTPLFDIILLIKVHLRLTYFEIRIMSEKQFDKKTIKLDVLFNTYQSTLQKREGVTLV